MFGVFMVLFYTLAKTIFFPEGMGVYIIVVKLFTCQWQKIEILEAYVNLTSMSRPRSNIKLHIGQANLSE